MITVHAPHCPWSQPFLLPVKCKCSRSASSCSSCALPFTSNETLEMTGGLAPDCCALVDDGHAIAAADEAPVIRNSRRVILMSLESCIVRILLSAIPLDDPQRHIHLARSLAMPLVICDISVD